jgi:hypothetical protein
MACDNTGCGCSNAVALMRDGRGFCGPYCMSLGLEDGEGPCDCGHAGCPRMDALDISAPKAAGA